MDNLNNINDIDDMHKKLHYIENNIDDININDIREFIYISHKFIIHNNDTINDKKKDFFNKRLKMLDDYIDNVNDLDTSDTTYRLLVINTLLLFISLFITYYSNPQLAIGSKYFIKKNGEYIFFAILIVISILTLLTFKFNLL